MKKNVILSKKADLDMIYNEIFKNNKKKKILISIYSYKNLEK